MATIKYYNETTREWEILATGKDGSDGKPGSKGDPGARGQDGARGPQGLQGPPGRDGKNFDYRVLTEAEYKQAETSGEITANPERFYFVKAE